MTTRNLRASRRGGSGAPAWDEASLFPDRTGPGWPKATGLALLLTAGGAALDLARIGTLGVVFQGTFFLGCLLAVVLVRRRNLFFPMVQPPLIQAVAVPGVVLLGGGGSTAQGTISTILAVATPLIHGFPTMAVTTALTLGLGGFRLATQRPPRTPRPRPTSQARQREGARPRNRGR